MFKNVFYNTRQSRMHLWEQIKGKDLYTSFEWVPYVFINKDGGDIKTIEGDTCVKKEFDTYNDYYLYQKEHYNVKENNVRPEIQFLAERYHGIKDEDMVPPKFRVYSLDIEINFGDTFPKASEAKEPVVLISVYDILDNITHSFGLKPYSGKYASEKWCTYVHCKDEEALMRTFFTFMSKHPCDVLTGWNVTQFDIQYLINRSKRLFGEDDKMHSYLSPIHNVRIWNQKDSDDINVDIAGVTILDYLELYKWFSPAKLERYTLEYVSNHELEKGKVDYSAYKDLRELYEKNWELYVEYNIIDAYRVGQLENKLGYIKLVQTLSLLSKAPMKFYSTQTAMIEGLFITHYRRNGLCAPTFYGGSQEGFPAAVVKEPQKGLHKWVIDLDITSSYPTAIITMNMSTETYYGRILGFTEDQMMVYVKDRKFPAFDMIKDMGKVRFDGKKLDVFNSALTKKLLCVAPCGSVFSTTMPGVIATVEKMMFYKRKEVKGKMIDLKKTLPSLKGKKCEQAEELIARYNGLQNAIKIILNSTYGILATPYSRYFNTNIAEAIVSCGRQTIMASEKFVNELLNEPNTDVLDILGSMDKDVRRKEEKDLVLYMDTDSLFINIGGLFDNYLTVDWASNSDEWIMVKILKMASAIEKNINQRAFNEVQLGRYNSNELDFKIGFKQEVVAKTVLFVKKKKYSSWHVNEEGAPVDKIKTTGLEIVRSDTPEIVRPMLKEIMSMILKGSTDTEIATRITKCTKELQGVLPEEIASNIGVHDLSKYIDKENNCVKGTPMHVKGVANYQKLLKLLKIEGKYEGISDGTKVKVLYVKKNSLNMDSIAFLRWPVEFDKLLQVDFTRQIEKAFLNKIEMLLDPMGKTGLLNTESKTSLNLFF